MGKPSPPAPPNPTTTIAAQSAANSASALQQAELNRINQNTPYGSVNYTTNGTYPDGTPMYTQTETLSPAEQNLLNLGQQGATTLANTGIGMLGQVQSAYKNPINYSGVPSIASSVNTTGAPGIQSTVNGGQTMADSIQQAQNAAYNAQTQYLDPRFQQQDAQLGNSLINQGITQGSAAYNTALQNENLAKTQAYQSAQDAAVAAGNQQQQALYGEGLSSANLANTANNQFFNQGLSNAQLQNNASNQALSQLYAKTNQPLNEYSALVSGSQVQMPQFQSYAQSSVPTTNVAGIVNQGYQNQLAYYQAQQAANPLNSILSLGGNLASAAMFAA